MLFVLYVLDKEHDEAIKFKTVVKEVEDTPKGLLKLSTFEERAEDVKKKPLR